MKIKLLISLLLIYSVNAAAQTIKTVNVSTPGILKTLITDSEQKTITTLTVSGNIDARDFAFMRDKMKLISIIDLTTSSIKSYTGTDGTNSGVNTTYPANEIPKYAFYNPYLFTYKSTITSIKFPSTTVSIGYLAFYYAWNLTGSVAIPSTVKSISDYAFYGCSSISAFSVVSTNTRYSSLNGVLFNKAQDTLFLFPQAKMGNYVIPTTVKHVGASAFENCYNLTTVTLPSALVSVGSYAFSYCSGITGSLILPTTLKKLSDGAFYDCRNLTGSVSIPASLTDLGEYCFLESNNITSFNVNSSNTSYYSNEGVLYSKNADTLFICPGGKSGSFTIPSTVKLIGSHAFYKCSKLTGTITIPPLVDYIGYYSFYGCNQISSYEVNANNAYFASENGVLMSKNKDRLITFPVTKSGNYQMPSTIKQIDPGAFAYCSNISGTLNIPATVNVIGDYAFYGCNQITGFEVESGNSRYSTKEGIIFNQIQDSLLICPLTKSGIYTIPNTVKYIGYSAFDGCNQLTEVIVPTSVNTIDDYAFQYCTGLTRVHLSESVSKIGNGAFYNCTALQKFEYNRLTPPVIGYYTLDQINKSTCLLIVPNGASSSYSGANYWGEFTQITESDFIDTSLKPNNKEYKIYSVNNEIIIEGLDSNDNVDVYTIQGILLKKTVATMNSFTLKVPVNGIYIVRIGEYIYKIAI